MGTLLRSLPSVLLCLLLAVPKGSCLTERPLAISVSRGSGSTAVELSFDVPGGEGQNTERSIQLTPGLTYSLFCTQTTLFESPDEVVWSSGGTVFGTDNSARIFAMSMNSRTWQLTLTDFNSATDLGSYSCQGDETTLTLHITAANPALIPDAPYLTLTSGSQGLSNRALLTVFFSGNPLPTPENGVWLYNNTMSYPPSSGPVTFDVGVYLFPQAIELAHAGIYTYTVTTTAGTASVEFAVQVIVEPDVSRSTAAAVTLYEGADFEVTCSDSTGVPRPTFSWRFNMLSLITGGAVVITDVSNSTHVASRLRLRTVSPAAVGMYECLASNSPDSDEYVGRPVTISVLENPLPPADLQAAPTSDCTVSIMWTTPPTQEDTASADFYIFEIQYIVIGIPGGWAGLGNSSESPFELMVPSRGVNTTYLVRGRGFNASSVTQGANSNAVGPYISYQDADSSEISDVSGRPVGSGSISVSWSIVGSMCYEYTNVSISCLLINDSTPVVVSVDGEGVANMQQGGVVTVSGLMADSRYDCHVLGRFSEAGGGGGVARIVEERRSEVVRTFTFPNAPPRPTMPSSAEDITLDRFTVTLEELPADEDISHYQILVLRLASADALPTSHPDDLYTDSSAFSNCSVVNDVNNKATPYQPYVAFEMSAAGFSPKFVVGGGVIGDRQVRGRCNEKVLPGVTYTVFVRAFPRSSYNQESLEEGVGGRRRRQADVPRQYMVFSSSGFLSPVSTSTNSPATGPNRPASNEATIIAVCVVVVSAFVIIVLAVTVSAICFYRRTHSKSLTFSPSVDHSLNSSSCDLTNYPDTPDLDRRKNGLEMKAMEAFADPLDVPFQLSGAVTREGFAAHVEKFDAKRQLLFQEEFEYICKKSPWHPAEASNDPRNDQKNRYSNITAFDHSRVKLKPKPGIECSDYINANYIAGYNSPREYICTQGPKDQTVEDFWRMVWEQRATTIIMLTNTVELGKIKCSQYWPISSKTMYGDISVTLENTHVFPDYIIRTLSVQLTSTNELRRVLQFHYTKWPDYGTPKLAAPLLNFLKIVHESNDAEETPGPLVVHCSAGVGRSGTVLTIDYCLQQLRRESLVTIADFVRNMREQRNYMVQTDQQYTFIHYAILEAITYGDTSYDLQSFMKSYARMQSDSPTPSPSKVNLEEEFQRLGTVKTMVKKSSFQNRIKVKGAPQRHFHSSFHGGSASGSLQQCLGHFLDGYNQSHMFVVTEGPDEMTANRFWELVWDHNVGYIIMLTPLDAEELFCYWPDSGEAEVQFGSIRVMVECESEEHLYTCRTIRLTNTKVEGISHHVIQYQFMGWTAQFLPRVPDFVTFACDVLKKVDTNDRSSKVMVHDTSSLGPAGIFCSLFYSIQRLQIEKTVDIFQAVQMIQLQRPGCMSDITEYGFLYDCVYEFLRKNS